MSTDPDAFRMPFTANRPFKKAPRRLAGFEPSPPLFVQREQIELTVDTLRTALRRAA